MTPAGTLDWKSAHGGPFRHDLIQVKKVQDSLFDDTDDKQTIVLPDAELDYYPGWLPNHEAYFQQLAEAVCWRQDLIRMYGREQPIPRLNAWYGDAGADYAYSGIELQPQPWFPLLASLRDRVAATVSADFNSVLVNWYRDGNDSVGWHSDDETELGPSPLIASVSLGATRRFSLRHKCQAQLRYRIDLAGGSLLVMRPGMQRFWQHQLAKSTRPVAGRINLTFRRIMG